MSKCMKCYLNTGFDHDYPPSEQHSHDATGKIVFTHSLDERVSMKLDEDVEHYKHTYYGVTPFHAEGTALARIIDKRLMMSNGIKDIQTTNKGESDELRTL